MWRDLRPLATSTKLRLWILLGFHGYFSKIKWCSQTVLMDCSTDAEKEACEDRCLIPCAGGSIIRYMYQVRFSNYPKNCGFPILFNKVLHNWEFNPILVRLQLWWSSIFPLRLPHNTTWRPMMLRSLPRRHKYGDAHSSRSEQHLSPSAITPDTSVWGSSTG